jgi:hypothetical protein
MSGLRANTLPHRFPLIEFSQEREPFDDEPLLLRFPARDQLLKVQLQRCARDLLLFTAMPIHQ